MADDQKLMKDSETVRPDETNTSEISPEELEKVSGGFSVEANTCEVHQKTAGDQDD
jgi:hypothetical protein